MGWHRWLLGLFVSSSHPWQSRSSACVYPATCLVPCPSLCWFHSKIGISLLHIVTLIFTEWMAWSCSIMFHLFIISIWICIDLSWWNGCRIVFDFFPSGFGFFLPFPVPFALYLQQFGTRTCHFAWYLLHFGMVTLHFAWYLLRLAMLAFQFAWYLSYFGISTSDLHGICYIFVLQTFMWVSWGFFRLSFRVSFKFHLGFHLGFYLGLHLGFNLGFHLGFLQGFI